MVGVGGVAGLTSYLAHTKPNSDVNPGIGLRTTCTDLMGVLKN